MTAFGESWAKRWRLAFNGPFGQKLLGGYASLLVDKARDWAEAAVLRSFPSFADRDGLELLSSGRRIEFDPAASDTLKAGVLLIAPTLWGWAGTPTGVLVALYLAGFPSAILVQQNGLAWRITGTVVLGDLSQKAQPTWVTRTVLASGNPKLPASADGRPAIPALTVPWWNFDSDMDSEGNQYTSRFGILFPSTAADPGLATASTLARIRRVVASWRDGKAKCMGFYVVTSGVTWDWPPGAWDDTPGDTWDSSSVTLYSAE